MFHLFGCSEVYHSQFNYDTISTLCVDYVEPAVFSSPKPLGIICNEPRDQETTGSGDQNRPAVLTAVREMISRVCFGPSAEDERPNQQAAILA